MGPRGAAGGHLGRGLLRLGAQPGSLDAGARAEADPQLRTPPCAAMAACEGGRPVRQRVRSGVHGERRGESGLRSRAARTRRAGASASSSPEDSAPTGTRSGSAAATGASSSTRLRRAPTASGSGGGRSTRTRSPGRAPSRPTVRARAARCRRRSFLTWYLDALSEFQNWQVSSVRRYFAGPIAVLYASWGMRGGRLRRGRVRESLRDELGGNQRRGAARLRPRATRRRRHRRRRRRLGHVG